MNQFCLNQRNQAVCLFLCLWWIVYNVSNAFYQEFGFTFSMLYGIQIEYVQYFLQKMVYLLGTKGKSSATCSHSLYERVKSAPNQIVSNILSFIVLTNENYLLECVLIIRIFEIPSYACWERVWCRRSMSNIVNNIVAREIRAIHCYVFINLMVNNVYSQWSMCLHWIQEICYLAISYIS